MQIPFLDLKKINDPYVVKYNDALNKCLEHGDFVLGKKLTQFENIFSNYIGVQNSIGVGNGFDALTILLKSLNIQSNQNILIPCNTYIATALSIYHAGIQIRLVPISEYDFCIDTNKLEEYIDENTKAIIVVHLYGHIMAMDKLIQIAKNHNLYLIEDAAQAHGASRDGIMAGNFGDGSIFSFYPTKNLGAIGDGGMICSNNVLLINWMKKCRNFGSTIKYEHEIIGCNSRLDELQAYFLNIKLETLDVENNKRRDIARFYLENLDSNIYKLPPSDNIDGDAWHLFVIRHKNRKDLEKYLSSKGIRTLIHYPKLIHQHEAFKNLSINEIKTNVCQEIVSIPNAPYLNKTELEYIVTTLNKFAG